MRRLVIACVFLVGACSPATTTTTTEPPLPTLPPTPTPTPKGYGQINVTRAMDHVRALAAEIGIREAGTDGDETAARYIIERLERLGWDVTEQTFPLPQGGTSTNIVASPPELADLKEPRRYVLVSAHRDSKKGPGANDNASGVALALEIARAVTEVPAPLPVVVVAFGAEEIQPGGRNPSRRGSRVYVSKLTKPSKDNLAVQVNLDTIGHGEPIICGRLDEGPREGTDRCVAAAKRLGIAAEERVLPDWSDHGPFAMAGLNTTWLWTGDVKCCYHNARDTLDNVRAADLERSGQLALAIVRSYRPKLGG
jgi:hypothetical protein